MGDDVIIGHDGKPRCAWAGAGNTALARYHDEVWGARTYDESALFEALTLGVFEAGLSWSIVFGKRDAFRRAFHSFDIGQVVQVDLDEGEVIIGFDGHEVTYDVAELDEISLAYATTVHKSQGSEYPGDRGETVSSVRAPLARND